MVELKLPTRVLFLLGLSLCLVAASPVKIVDSVNDCHYFVQAILDVRSSRHEFRTRFTAFDKLSLI